jgi:Flp pilus assembly CpaE family ATPase
MTNEPLPTVAPVDQHRVSGTCPLLAVCALCGGAGASTLAYLIGRHRARHAERPVLVCDTGGPTAGLSAYAGVESPRSLGGVADALVAGESLADGLFVEDGGGLRVLARPPQCEQQGHEGALRRVLHDAREAHALTVVDCGTLNHAADRWVLAAATHVAWVLPATDSAVLRGERVLAAIPSLAGRPELIVARPDASGHRPPTPVLKQLAAERAAPLVLMPHIPDLVEHPPEEALEAASVTLAAMEAVVRR